MIITRQGPQNIGQIKKQFEHVNLFLSPEEYQREGVWKSDQKQLLIDTIFREMDIPKFYLWKIDYSTLSRGYPDGETKDMYHEKLNRKRDHNDDPNPHIFEVVDGQQRIRTILEYMGERPPNEDVYRGVWKDSFPAYDDTPMAKGKNYSELNAEQQSKFDESPLTIMVLEKATIDEVRDMFLRLQNGTPLNAQQKRDAMGSQIGMTVRKLAELPFFVDSVSFDNSSSNYNRIVAQIFNLELKGKIISSTSKQLDKLYKHYKNIQVNSSTIKKIKKTLIVLGKIFPDTCPHLSRSYALSFYWSIARITDTYNINENDYEKIRNNFIALNIARLEAAERDYKLDEDEILEDLSLSMSRGTDGFDGISTRNDIIPQFLFEGINLIPHPTLDPKRAFTHEERLILYARAKGQCQLEHNGKFCGRHLDYDEAVADHIVPHSKGGETTLDNGRIAYTRCNISRGVRDDFDPETECMFLPDS